MIRHVAAVWPIIGAIVFFVLQQALPSYGTWYFMILGVVAILVAVWARRGLWGLVADRAHIRLFPVGYWLRQDPGATPASNSPARRDH